MSGEIIRYTVVNYVVEVRRPDGQWFTVAASGNTEDAEKSYSIWSGSRNIRDGALKIRLVERCAFISDEVIK